MRKFMSLFVLATLFLLPTIPVQSQTTAPPASISCDGTPAAVRVSEIKPGMMADFLKAVDAHRAWYRAHGFTANQIYASRVYDQGPNAPFSETEVLTFHVNPPTASRPVEQDDAYKAFVKMYRDTSSLKNEYRICMPKQP
ncbi:hypothetical protein [Granulicella sibirica]|uniref:Uncharacterized protein n=1 Tax=Granulicella sibirica TaxID=2479048 RepID=A0A4Q0T5Q9_9BACT|nr:hypothetical protein [Granulicella sibirica]RXH57428.1 hypothetical protein GRAN_0738 [Granulicella sibirica]